MNIFGRELKGEMISPNDPEYEEILSIIIETMNLCRELNSTAHPPEKDIELLEKF